jgi:hypothetical protein
MTLLATYRERRLEGQRHFELFEDTIVVRGKDYFANEFETTISLRALDPALGWVRTRTAGFWITTPLALLISIPLYCLVCTFLDNTEYLLLGFVGAGLLAIFLTLGVFIRKIEFSNFQNEQGITVLTVGRAGPDKEQYHGFVRLLTQQIEKVRQLA